MRKLLSVGVVVAALLAPASSRAGVLTLGARSGVSFGLGDAGGAGDFGENIAMSDYVVAQFPLQLDLLFRVAPGFAVGGYGSIGAGVPGDICDDIDCSALGYRLGVQATYSFPSRVSPWLGGGFGWEWNSLEDDFDETTFDGWELSLQGGVDFKLGRGVFSLGPYAMLSFGQYGEFELDGMSGELSDETMHEWLTFGIRGKFDL